MSSLLFVTRSSIVDKADMVSGWAYLLVPVYSHVMGDVRLDCPPALHLVGLDVYNI